jgi:hypothetical protein
LSILTVRGVFDLLLGVVAAIRVFFRTRIDTSLEVLALRQQMAVLKRKRGTLVDGFDHRETGDYCHMASERLSPLLAVAITASRWSAECE